MDGSSLMMTTVTVAPGWWQQMPASTRTTTDVWKRTTQRQGITPGMHSAVTPSAPNDSATSALTSRCGLGGSGRGNMWGDDVSIIHRQRWDSDCMRNKMRICLTSMCMAMSHWMQGPGEDELPTDDSWLLEASNPPSQQHNKLECRARHVDHLPGIGIRRCLIADTSTYPSQISPSYICIDPDHGFSILAITLAVASSLTFTVTHPWTQCHALLHSLSRMLLWPLIRCGPRLHQSKRSPTTAALTFALSWMSFLSSFRAKSRSSRSVRIRTISVSWSHVQLVFLTTFHEHQYQDRTDSNTDTHTHSKLLGKLTSVGKGRNSSAYKADTAQWECWQLQVWPSAKDFTHPF